MTIHIHKILLSTLILSATFTVGAVEVYEQKDRQGNVEFSDQPTAGAKAVEVNPNVVKVTPVQSVESAEPVRETKKAVTSNDGAEPVIIHQGVADDYDDERLRRTPRERELLNTKEGDIKRPAHKEIREGVQHKGGHRR
ncbi:MAG: hypothetical protein DRQ35_07045 [Gammaproteobacteria bacterium]|nr:MAG: hypothetical protein DRQ35_07045 [Gammaproteobacteria bacterium]